MCTQLDTSLSSIRTREREQKRKTAFDSAGLIQHVPSYCGAGKDTTLGISELVLRGKRYPTVIRVMADKDSNQSATNKNKWPVKKIRTSLGQKRFSNKGNPSYFGLNNQN